MRPFAIYLYGPDTGPLPRRFEEAADRLSAYERLHFEWDGSFVWRGEAGGEPWQVDGAVYDLGEQIQYVDLKGRCPQNAWRELLEIFAGSPTADVTILLLPHRQAMDRCGFEKEIWGKPLRPDPLA